MEQYLQLSRRVLCSLVSQSPPAGCLVSRRPQHFQHSRAQSHLGSWSPALRSNRLTLRPLNFESVSLSSSTIVTIAIEPGTPWIMIVKASSPSRATLSSTTRSAKSMHALGPGTSTVICAVPPKSVSIEKYIQYRIQFSILGTIPQSPSASGGDF